MKQRSEMTSRISQLTTQTRVASVDNNDGAIIEWRHTRVPVDRCRVANGWGWIYSVLNIIVSGAFHYWMLKDSSKTYVDDVAGSISLGQRFTEGF